MADEIDLSETEDLDEAGATGIDGSLDELEADDDDHDVASSFSGDVVVIADPTLEESDCTVEWADGGIRLDPSRVWRDIENILRTHLEIPESGAALPVPVAIPTETAPEPETADDTGRPN